MSRTKWKPEAIRLGNLLSLAEARIRELEAVYSCPGCNLCVEREK